MTTAVKYEGEKVHRRSVTRIAGALLALPIALGATTAHASTGSAPESAGEKPTVRSAVGHYSVVIEKSAKKNWTNKKNEIARCTVTSANLGCTISKAATATRTIDAGFGMSRGAVASSLNISKAKSRTVSVSCSAPKLKKGKSLVAYPIGTRHKYKIEKHMTTPIDYKTGTSGWKHAFNPAPAKVSCKTK